VFLISSFLFWNSNDWASASLKSRSKLTKAPGKFSSQPNCLRILSSRCSKIWMVMPYLSTGPSNYIILPKLGLISSSHFTASKSEMQARAITWSVGNCQWPTLLRYWSKILHALNSVSSLYYLILWNSIIFYMPLARDI